MRWAWVAFGAHTKVHGTNGVIEINGSNKVLAASMGVTVHDLKSCILQLPHMTVMCNDSDPLHFSVTWSNWHKFQVDDSSRRVAIHRAKKRQSVTRKKRGEENRSSPPYPPPLTRGRETRRKEQPQLSASEAMELAETERILKGVK